jgi:hypothetical protein
MNRASFTAKLLRTFLLASVAGSPVLWALESDPALTDPGVSKAADEQAFRKAIASIESSQGAYAQELPEQLLSLGLSLQAQGRHKDAAKLFKRGVHLARINNGLHSAEQIPLLQGQIASHIAMGNFSAADERQRYLYQVQVRSMGSGLQRTMAFMQQANWQHNAYRLDIGEQRYNRLMNMWDFYRLALNEVIAQEGEASPNLLPPLNGMLQAQYLISSYQPDGDGTDSPDDLGGRQQLNRFYAYRSQSYEKGRSVILAIYGIEREQPGDQSIAAARARVMLGDWEFWHDKRDNAQQAYREALGELAERDDAQIQADLLLGMPVALPDIDGIRPLPPAVGAEQGDILLEFGVNERGRVVNLERLDENEDVDAAAHRLMRRLRKTTFRPRFNAGEPIETEKLVRAYDIE